MVSLGLNISYEEAKEKVITNLNNEKAYYKFKEFVSYQQGNLDNLPESTYKYEIKSNKSGYLNNIDALTLGKLSMQLGAGRISLDDKLDYGAGIVITKNIGDYIEENDTLMELHTNKKINIKDISTEAFLIKNEPPTPVNLIYKVIK